MRDLETGEVERRELAGLFLLLGADPQCDWLPQDVCRDERGFVLTGRDLNYSFQSCPPGVPTVGCRLTTATAVTFAVSGGVPEPATWALMLLGFGGIGLAMRRRPGPARTPLAA